MGPDPHRDDRPLTREDLERAILRESPVYTAADASGDTRRQVSRPQTEGS